MTYEIIIPSDGVYLLSPSDTRCPDIQGVEILRSWESPGELTTDEIGEVYLYLVETPAGMVAYKIHEGPQGSRIVAEYGPDDCLIEVLSPCVCPLAGYCKTHDRHMSETRHQQCRYDPGYYDAFARSEGTTTRQPANTEDTGCNGCNRRKEKLNSIIPGAGDAVEAVTTATGIKDWWESRQ